MNAKLTSLRNHFANWREWELNPIVVKELRQGVRSWTVTGMLLLFLLVLFIASLGFLITQSFDVNENLMLGESMFSTFVVILAGASIFFIPLYTGVRVAAERQENNPDLLYVTTLSPARIIFGKFLCSGYLVLLFFSACMPFMAFTNLLRGVDLPTVFFILAFLFLLVCAANMVAIFLACLPMSRPFKFLFIIYGFFQSFFLIVPGVAIAYEMMRSGVGAKMAEGDFWMGTMTVAGLAISITGLLFVLSVALVSPPSANRALPVRLYMTVFWLLGGLLSVGWVVRASDSDVIVGWAYPTFILMMISLLVVISNSDTLSRRVRRKIPKAALNRFFAFFFFNGAAGGLVWIAAILGATYLTVMAVAGYFPSIMSTPLTSSDAKRTYLSVCSYGFDYALTAVFLQRRFLPRRPAKVTGLLAVLLAAGWALAPGMILFFANQLSWKSIEGLQLGNVFNVLFNRDSKQLAYHEYFAVGWLLIAICLNARWFLQQVKNFQPLKDGDGMPVEPTESGTV